MTTSTVESAPAASQPIQKLALPILTGMVVGSMVGSGGCMFLNEHTCIVTFIWRTALFYARESCGKCTPCRVGSVRGVEVIDRIVAGERRGENLDLLNDLCDTMRVGSLCALGGLTPLPVQSALTHFPEDFGVRRPEPA